MAFWPLACLWVSCTVLVVFFDVNFWYLRHNRWREMAAARHSWEEETLQERAEWAQQREARVREKVGALYDDPACLELSMYRGRAETLCRPSPPLRKTRVVAAAPS